MKTFAAALLVALSGKEVTEAAIKAVLKSVGAKENADEVKKLAEAMKGKKVEDLLAELIIKPAKNGKPAENTHRHRSYMLQ